MRLLNTTDLTFTDWEVTELPGYAILSHVWQEEEVLYKDMIEKSAENKKGYAKVVNTCKQAVKDGYNWVWIDSCCINKVDGAELSEAINSMYNWYAWAQVCYAYLEDVHVLNPLALELNPTWEGETQSRFLIPRWAHYQINDYYFDINGETVLEVPPQWQWTSQTGKSAHDFQDAFARSAWFTRGWTLQELLAPRQVVFYNHTWVELGTRKSLSWRIAQITGIEVSALVGGVEILKQLPAALKMSWASNRYTTKIEDMAYCLLGIFEITMPLLYGEGRKAFTRLQELIFLQHEDYSLFLCEKDYSDPYSTFAASPHAFHRNIRPEVPAWRRYKGDENVPPCILDFRDLLIPKFGQDREPPVLSQARGMKVTLDRMKPTGEGELGNLDLFWTGYYFRYWGSKWALCLELDTYGTRRHDPDMMDREESHRKPLTDAESEANDANDTWSRQRSVPVAIGEGWMGKFKPQTLYMRTRPIQQRQEVGRGMHTPEWTWVLVVHMCQSNLERIMPLLCKNVERIQSVVIELYSEIFCSETTRKVRELKGIRHNSSSFSVMLRDAATPTSVSARRTGEGSAVAMLCVFLPERCYYRCVVIVLGVVVHQVEEFWCVVHEVLHQEPPKHYLRQQLRHWQKNRPPHRELTDRLRVMVAEDECLTVACKQGGFRRLDIFGWVGRPDEGDRSFPDPLGICEVD